MLAPNPGEGAKSLQKAVSGGELSRVLLAIKTVMAELDAVPLLIFDEVDSGISGEVGNNIGVALRNLGKHHQVLTITHLHQVASRADNQLAVSKQEVDGRTYTSVTNLDADGRVDELVRMLGGESATVREHAKQLLENCE
jgi:DNA repair protein RecN (Recombination protein N)